MAAYHLPMRWRKPPARIALSGLDVHVWRARLDVDPAALRTLGRAISPDERERAGRVRRPAAIGKVAEFPIVLPSHPRAKRTKA
jgi:hypothetical protein